MSTHESGIPWPCHRWSVCAVLAVWGCAVCVALAAWECGGVEVGAAAEIERASRHPTGNTCDDSTAEQSKQERMEMRISCDRELEDRGGGYLRRTCWCVYIVIGVYTLSLVCIHCHWCVYIVIGVYASSFVCIHRNWCVYIVIGAYTS